MFVCARVSLFFRFVAAGGPGGGIENHRHFAVVGGSPLRGDRYFAGPPDTLAFEAAVIAEVRARQNDGRR